MATHVGTSGVVKVGANTVAEVTGFTLNETQDTVEDTSLTDSKKSYIAFPKFSIEVYGSSNIFLNISDTTV